VDMFVVMFGLRNMPVDPVINRTAKI